MTRKHSLSLCVISLVLAACSPGNGNQVAGTIPGTPGAPQTAFLWISAWEDAYAVSSPSNANVNYGQTSDLLLGRTNVSRSEVFVKFRMPDLPVGTAIEEAFLQVFAVDELAGHPTRSALVPIREADAWRAPDVTWNHRPSASAATNLLTVTPNDWARSDDMADVIRRHAAQPGTNHGFVLTSDLLQAPVPAINFIALGNDHTPSMFGLPYFGLDVSAAPRLLVRIRIPAGASVSDIVAPPSNHLADPLGQGAGSGAFPAPPRMLVETGADWPLDWNVR